MELKMKIRPYRTEGSSKESIKNRLNLNGFTVSMHGSYWREDDNSVYVINFQKFNRKTKQTRNKKTGIVSSKVIRYAHWEGYLYKIPKSWLKFTGYKVEQGNRTFKIK